MKLSLLRTCVLVGCISPLGLFLSASETTIFDLPANDPVKYEMDLVAAAHNAARSDDDTTTDAQIVAASLDLNIAPSVLQARRAMAVCGWLQNDNDYGRATKVAQRTLSRLAGLQENNDADRIERLYWEALLEGRILNHKRIALERLAAAKQIKPDDARIVELDQEFSAAVARFGR